MANKQIIIESDIDLKTKTTSLMFCMVQEYLSQINKRLRPLDISLTQLFILDMLDRSDLSKMTVNDIKKNLIDDSPNVSRSLNKLFESKRVVKERSVEDQRVVYISITEKGRETHKSADELIKDIGVNLEGNDLEHLYKLLSRL